jgi:hypothetical protein
MGNCKAVIPTVDTSPTVGSGTGLTLGDHVATGAGWHPVVTVGEQGTKRSYERVVELVGVVEGPEAQSFRTSAYVVLVVPVCICST